MKRRHLFEFEDQPWFPQRLREYMTDYLCFITSLNAWLFKGFVRKLELALRKQNERHIVDLCSGGGGPLPAIATILSQQECAVTVTLSDMYPNLNAFARMKARHPNFDFVQTSVDATCVPKDLVGFRTILNGFHHFTPEQTRQILVDAVRKKQGIAIMELVGRTPFSFVAVLLTPVFLALLTPFLRPFRFERLLLTYVVPLIPFFTLWDGLVSCLRVYSISDLTTLTQELATADYSFEVGVMEIKGTTGGITYLIGTTQS